MKRLVKTDTNSGSTIVITQVNEGNSTTTDIEITNGQFPFSEIRELKNGYNIRIIGEMEIQEIIDALNEFEDTK